MAISFKFKCSKTKDQQTITLNRDDNVDLSTVTSLTATVYKNSESTATNTYVFPAQKITDFVGGSAELSTENLIGSASPDDGFYSVELSANSAAYVSDRAGTAVIHTTSIRFYAMAGCCSAHGY